MLKLLFLKHAKYKHHDYIKLKILLLYDLTSYTLIIIVILF